MSHATAKAQQQAPGPAAPCLGGRSSAAPGGQAASALVLQRGAGNRAVSALVRTSVAQPTLQRCACAQGGGKCAKCQREEAEVLRRSAEPGAPPAPAGAGPMVQSVINAPGSPLESGVRREMEAHFDVSFGDVRVHTDGAAAASAAAVSARAYAIGQHIVFAGSSYAPGTSAGRHLLAHELAHTIQQRGAPRGGVQRLAIDPGGRTSPAEREADAAAGSVARGARVSGLHQMSASLQRFHVSSEKVGGCGICSKEQYGAGWQKKVGQQAHTMVQAAALGAALGTQKAMMQSELPITQKRNRRLPKTLPRITSKRDKDNGRLDLAVPTPTGFAIAEIKPSTAEGESEGLKDLEFYERIIKQRYPDATVERLTLAIPLGLPFIDKLAIRAGCSPQIIAAMLMQPGLIGYWCTPPYSEARRTCSCKKKKKDKKKKKKKQEKKKAGKQPKKKPDAKPKAKAPKAKPKASKLRMPKAKGASLSLGIGINSTGGGAYNVGVGISVNSSGTAVGTVGASITYDTDGNAIGAVGASAASRSDANVAGGAAVTASDKSSATGAGVAALGTAKESDVTGAGVASKGTAKGVSGTGVLKATSGDATDVDVTEAQSGKAGGGGKTEAGQEGPSGGEQAPGAGGDIRDTEEFKRAQAVGKRIEAMLNAASPAQKKLIAELVERHPEHLLPVPDEAFTKKWLSATAEIRDEHVNQLADAGWVPGTDIDEAEFKRRVQQVIAGKVPAGELWTSPEPPPARKPQTKPVKPSEKKPDVVAATEPGAKLVDENDPDAQYRGSIAKGAKAEGMKPKEVRAMLRKLAGKLTFNSDGGHIIYFNDVNVKDIKDKESAILTTVVTRRERRGDGAFFATIRITKRAGRYYVKYLDVTEAVTKDGKTFSLSPTGVESEITIE